MTEIKECDDHNCRYNNYREYGNMTFNSCQFSEIRIVDGKCNKRECVE